MIFAGEEQPESILLYEKPTELCNGVIVSIPIKKGDRREFEQKIQEQLAYFTNVYFENCGIDNNFKVVRNEHFQISDISNDGQLHLTLDDVYYPIDFNKLGISRIDFPVALRFTLSDGIVVIPNRENLEYTKETRKLITDKIKVVADWFYNKCNEDSKEFKSPREVYEYFNSHQKSVVINNEHYYLARISKYTSIPLVNPTYPGIEKLNLQTVSNNYIDMLRCYKTIAMIAGSGRYSSKGFQKKVSSEDRYPIILCEKTPDKKKIEFIKDTIGTCYFIKKQEKMYLKQNKHNLYDEFCYQYSLKLENYPKQDWRQVIKEYNLIVSTLENTFIKEEDIVITKEWLAEKKAQRVKKERVTKAEGGVTLKYGKSFDRYVADKYCKFESATENLAKYYKQKILTVYGLEEEKEQLSNWFTIFPKNSIYQVAIVNKKDYKTLNELNIHNLKTMERFTKENSNIIAKFVASNLISKMRNENTTLFKYDIRKEITDLNPKFFERLKGLIKFSNENRMKEENSEFIESLIALCEENKWYHPMYHEYLELKEQVSKFSFLDLFTSRYGGIEDKALPIIKELLIARKFKMDYTQYSSTAPAEQIENVEEEELEEIEIN